MPKHGVLVNLIVRLLKKLSFRHLVLCWVFVFGLFLNSMVWANAITVINNNDAGVGSLRQAIIDANANAGSTISFAPVLAGTTITLASGLPLVEVPTSFIGPSSANTIINANSFRGFFCTAIGDVSFSNLDIHNARSIGGDGGNGAVTGGGALGAGGAIFGNNATNIIVSNCNLISNSAIGGNSPNPAGDGSTPGSGGGGMLQGTGGSTSGASGSGGGGGLGAAGGNSGTPAGVAGAAGLATLANGGGAGGSDPVGGGAGGAGGIHGGGGGGGAYGAVNKNSAGGGGGINGVAAVANTTPGAGGDFGGGGGSNPGAYIPAGKGANGGFGGGGGGGTGSAPGILDGGGLGGFGGGNGGTLDLNPNNLINNQGQAGAGLGGAIFIRQGGSLTYNATRGNTSCQANGVTNGGGNPNPISAQGQDLYVMNGAVNFNVGANRIHTLNGSISGGCSINSTGSGNLFLNSFVSNYTGGTTINAGNTVTINSDASLGTGPLTLNGAPGLPATLAINAVTGVAFNSLRNINLNGVGGVINNNGRVLSLNGVINGLGQLVLSGNIGLGLGGANTYSGGTVIQIPQLVINSDGNLGNAAGAIHFSNFANSVLEINNNFAAINSNRNVTIDSPNSGIAVLSANFPVTFSGLFTANQTFVLGPLVGGVGTLVLTNPGNQFLQGILVRTGTLQGDTATLNANVPILNPNQNININSDGTLVFNQNFDDTLISPIIGTGKVVKAGNARLSLTGNYTARNTTVNGGVLEINGPITSNVVVNNAATLRGTGNITGNVILNTGALLTGAANISGNLSSAGEVQLGNGAGTYSTLNVTGNYIPTGGVTRIEINAAGQSSQIIVGQEAYIHASTLNVVVNPGGDYSHFGYYRILTASNIVGKFARIGTKINGYFPTQYYDDETNYLLLVYGRRNFSNGFGAATNIDKNTKEMARYFDGLPMPDPESDLLNNVINVFSLSKDPIVAEALKSIASGNRVAGSVEAQENAVMLNSIGVARLGALRHQDKMSDVVATSQRPNTRFALEDPMQALNQLKGKSKLNSKSFNTTLGGITNNAIHNTQPLMLLQNGKASVWIYGLGHVADQKSYKLDPGYTARTAGVLTGLDFSPYKNTFAGVALGKTSTSLSFRKNSGDQHVNNNLVMAYGTWYPNAWYVDASVTAGTLQYVSNEHIFFPHLNRIAHSEHDGFGITPHLGIGYDFVRDKDIITPFANLDFSYVRESDYQTTGALDLNKSINPKVSEVLRTEVGVKYYQQFPFANKFAKGTIRPNASISVINKMPFKKSYMTGTLVGQPGSFSLDYYNNTSYMVSPGVGADILFNSNSFLSLHLNSELGSRYMSYEVAAKFGIHF